MLMHCIQMARILSCGEPSLAALHYFVVCLFGKRTLANLQGWQQANWALHELLRTATWTCLYGVRACLPPKCNVTMVLLQWVLQSTDALLMILSSPVCLAVQLYHVCRFLCGQGQHSLCDACRHGPGFLQLPADFQI